MYVALKTCRFQGRQFLIGDEIEESLILPTAINRLVKSGYIAVVDGSPPPVTTSENIEAHEGEIKLSVPIHEEEEEDLVIQVTTDELIIFTDILQIGVNKTEDKQKISEMIQKVESEDLLIMLDALDGRKFIKEEAQRRAQEIRKDGDDQTTDEQPGGDE